MLEKNNIETYLYLYIENKQQIEVTASNNRYSDETSLFVGSAGYFVPTMCRGNKYIHLYVEGSKVTSFNRYKFGTIQSNNRYILTKYQFHFCNGEI